MAYGKRKLAFLNAHRDELAEREYLEKRVKNDPTLELDIKLQQEEEEERKKQKGQGEN